MSEITRGIMEMPYEMAMQSELSRLQFWNCAREIWQKSQAAIPPAAQVQGDQPLVVGQLALDEPFNGTEGFEIGEWEFVPERAVVESMLAVSTGEMVPLMTVAQHEHMLASLTSILLDPEAVLVNMLRGTIAIPSVRAWSKLFGEVINGEEAQLLEIARLRAALSAPPAAVVPEGWKLVPAQPNEAMLNQKSPISGKEERLPYWWYQALLKAAPTPPASEQQQAVVLPALVLERIEAFISGFEGDEAQEGVHELLAAIRAAQVGAA